MASRYGRLVLAWTESTLIVCLGLPLVRGAYQPTEYQRQCPLPDSEGAWTDEDRLGLRCCYEDNRKDGQIFSTYDYCQESEGCCGQQGNQHCCSNLCCSDQVTVYLAVGLTLGTLALLGIIFGIITCCMHAFGESWSKVCRQCKVACQEECDSYRKQQPCRVRGCDDILPPWMEMSPSVSADSGGAAGRPNAAANASAPPVNDPAPVTTQPPRSPEPPIAPPSRVPHEAAASPPPSYEEVMAQTRY